MGRKSSSHSDEIFQLPPCPGATPAITDWGDFNEPHLFLTTAFSVTSTNDKDMFSGDLFAWQTR